MQTMFCILQIYFEDSGFIPICFEYEFLKIYKNSKFIFITFVFLVFCLYIIIIAILYSNYILYIYYFFVHIKKLFLKPYNIIRIFNEY